MPDLTSTELALKKIENLHLSATPYMFCAAGIIAGLGHLATEDPIAKGWDLLSDPTFLKRAGVVTFLANIGFTILGTALDVYMQKFKASLKHQLQSQGIDDNDMTAAQLAAFVKKHPKTLVYDAVTGYLGGSATFFLFPYILVILGQISQETLVTQFGFSEAQAQLVTNSLTAMAVTGAFEVFNRVKLSIKQWLQFVPGIFGMTLGTSIAELVIAQNPNMSPDMQKFVRVVTPAIVGAASTIPTAIISAASNNITYTAKLCASSLSSLFKCGSNNGYQPVSTHSTSESLNASEDEDPVLAALTRKSVEQPLSSSVFDDEDEDEFEMNVEESAAAAANSSICNKLATCFGFGR